MIRIQQCDPGSSMLEIHTVHYPDKSAGRIERYRHIYRPDAAEGSKIDAVIIRPGRIMAAGHITRYGKQRLDMLTETHISCRKDDFIRRSGAATAGYYK